MIPSASTVEKRISKLLQKLEQHEIDVYLVPSMDEHLNEFVPQYKQRLKAITGFSGSAGTALFRRCGKHQLFVDSRYHLQAGHEVAEDWFVAQKLGLEGVPTVEQWLVREANRQQSLKIGFDPFTMSPKTYRLYLKNLKSSDSRLIPIIPNLIDQVWEDRPQAPCQPFYLLDLSWTGETTAGKLERIREKMHECGVQALVLSKLDEIAWITNSRGNDIDCNPVFEAYCVIDLNQAFCFTLAEVTPEVQRSMNNWFQFKPYAAYEEHLQSLSNLKIWLDPASTTMGTYLALHKKGQTHQERAGSQYERENPVVLMKALKNHTEIKQIRKAHHYAACGKIRSFVKLYDQLERGVFVSERSYAESLYQEYSRQEGFVDLSFPTIAGFAENSAIVHYSNPSAEKQLMGRNMLLVDSGIQIAGGTTDDTRTLAIGEPTARQKTIYTRVLQSHIRLALQKFPAGTHGASLDAVARSPLWNEGMDYGHGTGHGVGAFLNVHEGPHNISPLSHNVDLRAGMIVSNEPGYYETGWGGVRLENLYVVVPCDELPSHPGGKSWLQFDSLTMIPFDRRLIDPRLLQEDERRWLQDYHQRVWDEISSYLQGRDLEWLKEACQPIKKYTSPGGRGQG